MEEQVAIIYSGTRGYLDKIPVSEVGRFEEELLRFMRDDHKDLLATIRKEKELTDDSEEQLKSAIEKFTKRICIIRILKETRPFGYCPRGQVFKIQQ